MDHTLVQILDKLMEQNIKLELFQKKVSEVTKELEQLRAEKAKWAAGLARNEGD